MTPNPQPSGFSTLSFDNSGSQTRASQKDSKGRKFFQQMQPTFSIDVPTTTFTKLEFLDNFDPAKDTVVRKKAREWVNKNREITNLSGQAIPKSRSKNSASKAEDEDKKAADTAEEYNSRSNIQSHEDSGCELRGPIWHSPRYWEEF